MPARGRFDPLHPGKSDGPGNWRVCDTQAVVLGVVRTSTDTLDCVASMVMTRAMSAAWQNVSRLPGFQAEKTGARQYFGQTVINGPLLPYRDA